jgi:endonuclease YncB( thermonuclease family)
MHIKSILNRVICIKKNPYILFVVIFLFSGEVFSQDYKVTKVFDGDTFIAEDGNVSFKVRIAGIDAPEYKQPYSNQSKEYLKKLILNKKIQLKPIHHKLDKYNRLLAQVYLGERNVGLELVREGLAFYYRPFCRDYPHDSKKYNYDPSIYVEAEKKAKDSKLNIWKLDNLEKPCEFRRRKK